MSTGQIIALGITIGIGVAAVLCYATLWAEPREEDPAPPADLVDIDTEFL